MAARKELLNRNLQYVQVSEYLNDELKLAGQGKIEIHKTPMGHRVVIHAVRLGMVIGRRGRNIRRLTETLEHAYGLETPQLEIKDLDNPRLNSRVMAGRLISQIQKGFHFRRAGYALVRRIMAAEARGCEITIKGKLTSQRSRSEVFREGFVAKCGEPSRKYVENTVMEVTMKQGVIGVHVKIMQPDAVLPDNAILIPDVFGKPEDKEEDKEEEIEEEIPSEIEEEIIAEIKQEVAESTKKPETVESTKKPVKAKSTKKPETVESTKKPETVESTKKPETVESTKKPVKAKSTKKPKTAEKKTDEAKKDENLLKSEDLD